jgi:translocation and assembly module TamA
MFRKLRVLLAMAVIGAVPAGGAGCATSTGARGEEDSPPHPHVAALELQGVSNVSEEALRGSLIMQAPAGWPFRKTVRFDPQDWDSDLRRIERFYVAHGHYDARVVESHVEETKDGVRLRVRVEEGAPVHIAEVRVEWHGEVPADVRAAVEGAIPYQQGKVFREMPWDPLRETLTRVLMERGYAAAQVQGEVRVHPPSHAAVVHLVVAPGQPYRFGSIAVTAGTGGLVPLERISAEVRREVPEAQPFSLSALRRVQERIFAMGLFSIVRVAAGAPEPDHLTVPVLVDVRERPLRTLRAGGGLELDQGRNELRVLGEFAHRDFLGGFRTLRVRGAAGYAAVPDFWSVLRDEVVEGPRHGPVARLRADLEQPRLFVPELRGFALVEAERGLEQAYDFLGGRTRLGTTWSAAERWTIRTSYNLEVYRLGGPALELGAQPQAVFGCPQPCVLSYLEERAVFDARDDPVQPRRGYFFALSLQQAGTVIGSSMDYLRLQPEARVYVPMGPAERWIVGARLQLGTLLTRGGQPAPILARFFSGGASAMRGFPHHRLSPMLIVPATEELGAPVQVGGNGLVEGSVELRYLMTERLGVVTFADTGTVTVGPLSPSAATGALQYAVGAGLRYRSPLGPLRLDLAYRLPVGPSLPVMQLPGGNLDYPITRGCLGIGGFDPRSGSPEGPCTLFFSVGEAF